MQYRASKALIASACAGDENAMHDLVPHIQRIAFAAIRRRFGVKDLDERVHNAVVASALSLHQYQVGDGCAFSTWVTKQAEWSTLRAYAHNGREKRRSGKVLSLKGDEEELADHRSGPHDLAEESEALDLVVEAISDRLHPRTQAMMLSRVMEGRTLQEVAVDTGRTRELIRIQVDKACRQVLRRLNLQHPKWVEDMAGGVPVFGTAE